MKGVEVLSEHIIYEQTACNEVLWICLAIGAGIGLLLAIYETYWNLDDWPSIIVFTLIGALLGLFFGCFVGLGTVTDSDVVDYIEYKVTISDEVNFNEFCNKYEILDQDGKIFIVKERIDK